MLHLVLSFSQNPLLFLLLFQELSHRVHVPQSPVIVQSEVDVHDVVLVGIDLSRSVVDELDLSLFIKLAKYFIHIGPKLYLEVFQVLMRRQVLDMH